MTDAELDRYERRIELTQKLVYDTFLFSLIGNLIAAFYCWLHFLGFQRFISPLWAILAIKKIPGNVFAICLIGFQLKGIRSAWSKVIRTQFGSYMEEVGQIWIRSMPTSGILWYVFWLLGSLIPVIIMARSFFK